MTANEKRLMMLKKIINSDNSGIDILYEKFNKNHYSRDVTSKDIMEAMASVTIKYLHDDPISAMLFGIMAAEAVDNVFNKEDK